MRKMMKRALSIGLVLTMVLAMGTTALAAETKTYNFTRYDGTSFGSFTVTNVLSDTVDGGIKDGNVETPTIKITTDSLITYNIEIEGVYISDSQGERVGQEEVIKVSNAVPNRVLDLDEELIEYQKGYTIQFIKTGTYRVGINGNIDGMSGVGFYGVNYEVTDGSSTTPAAPTTPPVANTVTATPNNSQVIINGVICEFDAYTINGNNYFKLRDIAHKMTDVSKLTGAHDKQFEVTWNGEKSAIELISNKNYTPVGGECAKGDGTSKTAIPSTSTVYKDGEVVELTAYTINGNNYFKLRDLGQAFDFNVSWDGANNCIIVETGESYTAD